MLPARGAHTDETVSGCGGVVASALKLTYADDHCFYYVPEGPVLPDDPAVAGGVALDLVPTFDYVYDAAAYEHYLAAEGDAASARPPASAAPAAADRTG